MLAVMGHYAGGAVQFDHMPPALDCNVIITFLDETASYDPIDTVAATRLDTITKHYSDKEVRGAKAVAPVVIDDNDGWE